MTGDLQESKLKEIPNYDINEMQRDIEKQKVEEDQSRNSSTFPIVTVSNVSYHEINYRYDRNDKRFEYDASEIFIANEVQDGNSKGFCSVIPWLNPMNVVTKSRMLNTTPKAANTQPMVSRLAFVLLWSEDMATNCYHASIISRSAHSDLPSTPHL